MKKDQQFPTRRWSPAQGPEIKLSSSLSEDLDSKESSGHGPTAIRWVAITAHPSLDLLGLLSFNIIFSSVFKTS
jgi:hypothetical protein